MTQEKKQILLVDDDQETLELLQLHLEKEGFYLHVVKSGEEAIDFVSKVPPILVILEIVLPGLDGVEVCRAIRELPSLGDSIIIFLTTRAENYSEIAAFEAGADDYIVKPVRPRVFLTRLNTLLKRRKQLANKRVGKKVTQKPNLIIDKEKMISIKNGKKIHWQNKEFKLLTLLTSKPGKVFSRTEIYKKVWENKKMANERLIDVYIRRVREKIGADYIVTIFGKGYKYVE